MPQIATMRPMSDYSQIDRHPDARAENRRSASASAMARTFCVRSPLCLGSARGYEMPRAYLADLPSELGLVGFHAESPVAWTKRCPNFRKSRGGAGSCLRPAGRSTDAHAGRIGVATGRAPSYSAPEPWRRHRGYHHLNKHWGEDYREDHSLACLRGRRRSGAFGRRRVECSYVTPAYAQAAQDDTSPPTTAISTSTRFITPAWC